MPLLATEIQPGCFAWFDVAKLFADPLVQRSQKDPFRNGPFICVQEKDGQSAWVALTRENGPYGRTWVKDDWRLHGGPDWRDGTSYFNSLEETFVGPNGSFIAAASNESSYAPHVRPRLSDEGLTFVMDRLRFNKALLLK